MPAEEPRKRRLRAPGPRRFAAGATATFVAVFGVLALRLHDGDDPALQGASPANTSNTTASRTSSDPYDTSTSGDDSASSDSGSSDSGSSDSSAVTSTPPASTSAS